MPKNSADVTVDNDTGHDNEPMTEHDLIEQMAGFLEDNFDEVAGNKEEEEDDEGEEASTGKAEDDEDEEESEGEDEGEEDEGEEEIKYSIRIDGKKATLEDLLAATTHVAVVDGEEIEVPYEELVNGYQRGRDYAKKTTELKREREEIAPYAQLVAYAKNDPQFGAYIKSYFEHGPYPEAASNPNLRVSDDELAEMLDEGSDKYDPQRATQIMKDRKDWLAKARDRQEVDKKARAEAEAALKEWAEGEIEKAREAVSALGGDLEKDIGLMAEHLLDLGFSQQEILSILDSRVQVMAWEAAQYRELKKSATAPGVRLGAKRKKIAAPRIAGAGTGKREPSNARQQRDTLRKAVKTQRDEDWVNAIAARLKI